MKKWIALLLALVMVLSMTACGASEAPKADAPAAEAPKADAPAAAGLPYEGETLTVLYMSGVYADAARAMVPEFEAATGAKVEVVDYPYLTLHEKALLDLTSFTGSYDVIDVASQWDGEFAPFLEPLTDYIARDNYDMTVWIDNVLANCGDWQGTIIGIPNASTPQTFAYRTDLLPNGIPDTWEEYREALAAAQNLDEGVYGVTVSEVAGQLGGVFDYVLWSMGGKWANEEWKVSINSNEGRSALTYLNSAKSLSNPECLEWTRDDAIQAFLDGKAAVCETQAITELLLNGDDPALSQISGNWAFGRIPHEKTGITSLSAWDSVIPAVSQDKDLAWEWIKMYSGLDMQNRFYDEFLCFSPRKDFWEQEKMASLQVLREALDTANGTWRIPAFTEAESSLSETLSSFLTMEIYQDSAIRRMEKAVKTMLETLPPEEGIQNANR